MPNLKQSLRYNISVEGEVCEKLYFEHLSRLINECDKATYKVSFDIKKKNPSSFYKSRVNTYARKKKGKAKECITYFHVQDIECYETHNDKFVALINEIKKLEEETGVYYQLGIQIILLIFGLSFIRRTCFIAYQIDIYIIKILTKLLRLLITIWMNIKKKKSLEKFLTQSLLMM